MRINRIYKTIFTYRHARAGLSFDDIQMELGVATQCGRCEDCARGVVSQCSVSQPTAALRKHSCAGAEGACGHHA